MHPDKSPGKVHSFQLPRKILFGVKASEKVGSEAKASGGKRALLVTDENLVGMGVATKIEKCLVKEGLSVDIFSSVKAEPHLEVAESVAVAARKGRYDIVVGVGGGSVLDMTKVAAMSRTNPGPMREYLGVDLVKKPSLPSILLPTTAGTGSEVTNVVVVTVAEEELKTAIISPYMLGHVAIVDPSLTYSMPPRLTASTGLDALSHALEAIISTNANLITDILALESIRLIFTHLPRAYEEGDAESRYGMSLGSLTAGMAFGNAGVCLGHAVAYTFAVTYNVTHGVSCGLALPYVLRFVAPAISWKLPQIAKAMNLDPHNLGTKELTYHITESIFKLMYELQMPRRLRDLGIPAEALPKLAERLLTFKRLIQRVPRRLSEKDALTLFEEMW